MYFIVTGQSTHHLNCLGFWFLYNEYEALQARKIMTYLAEVPSPDGGTSKTDTLASRNLCYGRNKVTETPLWLPTQKEGLSKRVLWIKPKFFPEVFSEFGKPCSGRYTAAVKPKWQDPECFTESLWVCFCSSNYILEIYMPPALLLSESLAVSVYAYNTSLQ